MEHIKGHYCSYASINSTDIVLVGINIDYKLMYDIERFTRSIWAYRKLSFN
jgi:glutathionyl-hydroquinone reductase